MELLQFAPKAIPALGGGPVRHRLSGGGRATFETGNLGSSEETISSFWREHEAFYVGKSFGITLVVITHDLYEAVELSTHTVLLSKNPTTDLGSYEGVHRVKEQAKTNLRATLFSTIELS
jgi:hypothetical protein